VFKLWCVDSVLGGSIDPVKLNAIASAIGITRKTILRQAGCSIEIVHGRKDEALASEGGQCFAPTIFLSWSKRYSSEKHPVAHTDFFRERCQLKARHIRSRLSTSSCTGKSVRSSAAPTVGAEDRPVAYITYVLNAISQRFSNSIIEPLRKLKGGDMRVGIGSHPDKCAFRCSAQIVSGVSPNR